MQEHKQRGGCSPVGKHFAIFADLVPAHPIGGVAARPPPLDYRHQHGMTLWIFGVSASARFLLWAQRVRDVRPQTNQCRQTRPFTGPWESCDSIRPEHALAPAAHLHTPNGGPGLALLQPRL